MKSDQPRYAIRKYAVGAASVLIGFFAGANVVAADTPTATDSPSTTVPTQPSEGGSTTSLNVNRHCLIVNCGYQILTV